MERITIVGILIKNRIKEANKTQTLHSEYGHIIRTRIRIHEVSEAVSSQTESLILTLGG